MRTIFGLFLVWGCFVSCHGGLFRSRNHEHQRGARSTALLFGRYIRLTYQPVAEETIYEEQEASWAYNTNITDHNRELMMRASEETAFFDQSTASYVRSAFGNVDFSNNITQKRLYDKLILLGDAYLNATDFAELQEVENRMQFIYSNATICGDPNVHADDFAADCPANQLLELEPHISGIFTSSRNETLLRHVWKSWRDATGRKMRTDYARYVELKNKAARMDGFVDNGASWRSTYVDTITGYTDQNFLDEVEAIWQQVKPLYEQLHAYVRHKLKGQYPTATGLYNANGPIPAHLLGNMWAQTWGNLQEFRPHPDKQSLDVTEEMVRQNYTALKMFGTSDDFFASLGLTRMPREFWEKSMIEKPTDGRRVVCHASAWDFYNRKDFRIKQCTEVTMGDFFTVHHEMGHVEYYLQYKDLEVPFRRGANDGFHEAVGDTLALSVQTPSHLKSLGLLMADFDVNDAELERNSLFSTAMEKIAFLPFGYLMDKYRYEIFNGTIAPEEYNTKWWEYLAEYQGICAPVKRTEGDFDPGAKYHIPAGVPYMRYFVSFIIQFQFHKAMCNEAGYDGPLHRCDVSAAELGDGGKRAGALLAKTLKMGSSRPWQEAISVITSGTSTRMDAGPLLEFFAPMMQWLTEKNVELGVTPGWSKDPECTADTAFEAWLNIHNNESSAVKSAAMFATWAYQTNITAENEAAMLEASNVAAAFAKKKTQQMLALFSSADDITDPTLNRVYGKLSKLGDAALSAEDFARLGAIRTEMEKVYSVAKVCNDTEIRLDMTRCPKEQQMALSPDITNILHSSRDPEELLYYWHAWRDSTGREMRNNFTEYVGLKNEAAVADGYKDSAEAWRAPYVEPSFNYTDANFLEDADRLWNQMKPLYQELHAYIRFKLNELYGDKVVPNLNGPIPAHLLSNMWAQTWAGLLDFTEPFPGKPELDVTQEMQRQGWTARKMFNVSETFFTDLGLEGMPPEFWEISMIEKPTDREVVCHASAEDFYDGVHFGIKQCTAINMADLLTVHHEMGHVEYFIQYKNQHIPFRDGANDGFHEAVGDVMSLSVSTPAHLEKLNLLSGFNATDEDAAINFMYSTALKKIAFLPFGLVMDMYRYDVFNGKITSAELNRKWWEYVVKYQGICHAVPRDENDFDPGAKFHTAADVPYMRYFVSFVIQFQFHEALCKAANHTGPLHTCDIDGSLEAGRILGDALSLGSSQPWQVAMRIITGQDDIDARPLLAYFKPLQDWLQAENQRLNQTVGWNDEPTCIYETTTTTTTTTTIQTLPTTELTSTSGSTSTGSTITGPTVTVPTETVPTVTGPTVTVPTVTGPTVTVPTVTGPTVTVPTVTEPTRTTPPIDQTSSVLPWTAFSTSPSSSKPETSTQAAGSIGASVLVIVIAIISVMLYV